MNDDERKKLLTRINRIAGQVAGVQRMVEQDRYCVEILQQIAAVRSALDALGVELLTKHLECCVVNHGGESTHECARTMSSAQLLEEVRTTLAQFLR